MCTNWIREAARHTATENSRNVWVRGYINTMYMYILVYVRKYVQGAKAGPLRSSETRLAREIKRGPWGLRGQMKLIYIFFIFFVFSLLHKRSMASPDWDHQSSESKKHKQLDFPSETRFVMQHVAKEFKARLMLGLRPV